MLYVLLFLLVVVGFLYLLAPGRTDERIVPFLGRDYAHRGLHDNASPAPENSLLAFKKAVEKGYGIELDVQLSADGQLVVFHDFTLKRACGVKQSVASLSYAELGTHPLFESDQRIPLLADVLTEVAGKVPLIIELKIEDRAVAELCEAVMTELSSYMGLYCVESFNPLAMAYFKHHYPHIVRGQLSGDLPGKKGITYTLMRHLLTNFLSRPHFVAYKHQFQGNICLNLLRILYRTPLIAYTVTTQADYDRNQKRFTCQIFEQFEPERLG